MLDQSLFALTLGSVDELIPLVAIIGGITVALVAIIGGNIRQVMKTRAREESRREIAAYVAEGSMAPADAERLIEAGTKANRATGCGDA